MTHYNVGASLKKIALDIIRRLPSKDTNTSWFYFAKWAEAYSIVDQEPDTHCRSDFLIHSDQFQCNLFRELCKILGIDQTGTSPYHPSLSKSQRDWDKRVPFVMLANRSSIRESTREFPSYMMSGRELLLPVDLTFGRTQDRQIKADFIHDKTGMCMT